MNDDSMFAVLLTVYLPINLGFLSLDWKRVNRLPFLKKIFWIAIRILIGIFLASGGMITCVWQDMRGSRA